MSTPDLTNVVRITNARLSFPAIAAPQMKKQDDGTERVSYNATFLMLPTDPAFAELWRVINVLAAEKWKDKAQAILGLIQNDKRLRCYGRGEEQVNSNTLAPYDGYPGMIYVTAGRQTQPQLIDAQGHGVDPVNTGACQQLARALYGGCRVNAAVKPWLQENKYGRGVRCDLISIQFLADDTPFGGGVNDASALFGATPQAATQGAPAGLGGLPPLPGMPQAGAPAWTMPGIPQAQPMVMPQVPFPGAAAPSPGFLR